MARRSWRASSVGLRTVELRREEDRKGGQGFAFVINGVEIFAKGANVIPLDAFPARVDAARLRQVLTAARDANMNMLRNWGGGYYEDDAFFDIADELGLLVWQDFMFGGGMQPATIRRFVPTWWPKHATTCAVCAITPASCCGVQQRGRNRLEGLGPRPRPEGGQPGICGEGLAGLRRPVRQRPAPGSGRGGAGRAVLVQLTEQRP